MNNEEKILKVFKFHKNADELVPTDEVVDDEINKSWEGPE